MAGQVQEVGVPCPRCGMQPVLVSRVAPPRPPRLRRRLRREPFVRWPVRHIAVE